LAVADPILAAVDAIRQDSRSGAIEIANRAALLLMPYCDGWIGGDDGQFRRELATLCGKLLAAQPGMAPMVNLCNEVVQAAENPGLSHINGQAQTASAPQAASDAALKYYAFVAHHTRRIANEVLPYIHSGSLLLTHSSSATVLAALLRAREAGKRFGVVCTESRPQCEGAQMARQLAAAGIGVEVIADAAAAVVMHGFYTLLIGADAITPSGVINKVGTLGMALAARSAGVPVYCLAGSEKFLPRGAEVTIEERDPTEIVPGAKDLQGFNIYFDQTPLDLITKFFSEEGVLSPAEVAAKLAEVSLHPSLRPQIVNSTSPGQGDKRQAQDARLFHDD
jgi:translation initiation factor 2B subunit (eIF-2B alpha/beta/delta family)